MFDPCPCPPLCGQARHEFVNSSVLPQSDRALDAYTDPATLLQAKLDMRRDGSYHHVPGGAELSQAKQQAREEREAV